LSNAGSYVMRSASDPIDLLDRFAAAWNRHDLDALMSMMTDDCVFESSAGPNVDGQRSEGKEAVRAAYAAVFAAFPDPSGRTRVISFRAVVPCRSGPSPARNSTVSAWR
jgi:uncharacterized protein (TIGR02246 family)